MVARKNRLGAFFVVGAFAVLTFLLIFNMLNITVRNETHANTKHIEAPRIRRLYRNGLCDRTEFYYHKVFGTILILCKINGQFDKWGGLTFRVTENREDGLHWNGNRVYECSAYIAKRQHWENVINRGYIDLFSDKGEEYMWILNLFLEWYK